MTLINGQVSDATTGQGIPLATIAVNGKAVGAADSGGNFTVSVDDLSDTITASSVGYVTLSQQASSVLESGVMQLGINSDTLPTATVTAKKPSNNATWLVLAGIGIIAVASSKGRTAGVGKIKGKDLIPIAALGIGAYLVFRPKTALSPAATPIAPYAPTTVPSASSNPLSALGPLAGLASSVSKLFGASSSNTTVPGAAAFIPVQTAPITNTNPASFDPAANFPTLSTVAPSAGIISPGAQTGSGDMADGSEGDSFDFSNLAGIGDASSSDFSADQIIGKSLSAAQDVQIYDTPGDSETPVATIKAGNPIGIVTGYLSPNPDEDRQEIWWQFTATLDQQSMANSLGEFYVPHKTGSFNIQDLVDQGALTVAQATALQKAASGNGPGLLQTEIEKYAPWVIGGLLAVGIAKAVINKAF